MASQSKKRKCKNTHYDRAEYKYAALHRWLTVYIITKEEE